MKKTISVILALLIAISSFSFGAFAYSNGEFQLTVDQAVEEHEITFAEEVETNRYYFLMPNGTNGDRGEDVYNDDGTIESYGKFEESWYNEYTDGPAIYWWNSGVADPPTFPGYIITRCDEDNVYYADVPKAVEHIIWNNNVDGGMDTQADIYNFARLTTEISTKPYEAGESDIYEQGLDTFDNMIYVIDPDKVAVSDISQNYPHSGEWYYYYGDGCYGTVKDGSTEDCIRDDHEHSQKGDKYSEQFEQYLKDLGYSSESENWYEYNEVYEYFAQGNNTHIPDWILATGYAGAPSPAEGNGIFGEYNLKLSNVYTPVGLYHIYIPSENKFYTLSDAWTKKIANIKEAFTEYFVPNGYAELIEDSDGDGIITKVDAEKYDGYFTYYNSFDCIEEAYLHFDANTTGWNNYKKIFCHIWEYGGDCFFNWHAKKEQCRDDDKDGIWTYDLASKGIELDASKQYVVIFSNENGLQAYNLLFDNTVLGDTAYCDGTYYESPEGTVTNPQFAYWRNQDKKEYGPELRITSIGTVTGTCVSKTTTEYEMFKDFLENYLVNAQIYSGKTDQALLDDLAKELGLSSNDVESAIIETGIENIEWVNYDNTPIEELDIETLIERYKFRTGAEFETKRYYFLMPNVIRSYTPETPQEEHEENWTWYNEYSDCAYIYWDGIDDLLAEPSVMPDDSTRYLEVGCKAMQGDEYNVYYADIPDFVTSIVWNNGVKVKDEFDPMFPYAHRTENIMCEYYDAGESETYPDGLESFENMIYVLEEGAQSFGNPVACEKGEWYYYYGDGCYGFVKDGKTADCIRGDHDHSDRFLYFDANSTNWRYYEKIYCHIWEYGGDPFYMWQQKAELCTDNDGDGIWTYDLVEHNIELDESKQYAVIFSNENAYQTYNLIFDKTVLGDTAYCDGTNYESPEDARYPQIAYWRNQDKAKFGPEMQIDLMGNVQGTCIPKSKTKHGLFKDFLENYLVNAQIYSGKTDQALLDDLAKELKISADDVERAIMETGVDVEWKHPDKLSVKEAVKNYEEKTGEKVDTIRYYFLMPNGRNGQRRTDTTAINPFATSWYNTYANKPGVYWWDVAGDLDPPRFPGYYFEESESKDVYYVDLPKDVKSVLWNNYIFESMDTADDPMRAYSRYTDEAILPHQIYNGAIDEQTIGWIYVVDPDSEWIFDNGKQTYSGKWYFYYGDGCYGETSDGECIRGDHDHRVYDTYIVAGVEKLCGSSWDATDTNNKMTYNEKTGAYEITYTNVPVGNHEFMVTKNFEFGSLTPGSPDYNEAKVTVDGSIVRIAYTEGVGVSVEVIAPIIGDVDLDGVVSIMDATEIQLAVAKKKTLTNEQEKLADTDFDGEISIMDATAIQLFVAKKITQFK